MMSKNKDPKSGHGGGESVIQYCKSSFTLTFAIEIVGMEIWHDCNEGWLDLGPCFQGLKLQYQLYHGQNFDLDILIWPHVSKIWAGNQCAWVRSWQYLQRRWLAFSIKHMFPVRVIDLQSFTVTVNPIVGVGSLGAKCKGNAQVVPKYSQLSDIMQHPSAKNDRVAEVFLPSLEFGQKRYFAPVLEADEPLESYVYHLIMEILSRFIPAGMDDEIIDTPFPVKDVRHQDAVIETIREIILNVPTPKQIFEEVEIEEVKGKDKKDKAKKAEAPKQNKFEIKIQGDEILSNIFLGVGRIVKFESVGDRPAELGEIVVLLSSFNLPAQDDLPIFFLNIENLFDVPVEHLQKLNITQIYTRWSLNNEVHESLPQPVKLKKDFTIKDHHAVPLYGNASEITAKFLDKSFPIELRGKRPVNFSALEKPTFFGYLKNDRNFGKDPPPKRRPNDETDILIAVTKLYCSGLAKGVNEFIRGEFPLYPPRTSIVNLQRPTICTNDINAIGLPIKPDLIVQPYIILEAQMTMEASLGLVGCRLRRLATSYSRIYALISDRDSIVAIIRAVNEINRETIENGNMSDLLTGFALDTSDVVVFYIEGPRDGVILKIWEFTADFYPTVKPLFCSSARYHSRIYENMVITAMPFLILKMYLPLGVLLACPPVYARPALPIPTRNALLKIGRIVASKLKHIPCRCNMPTEMELSSFRLELCMASKSTYKQIDARDL